MSPATPLLHLDLDRPAVATERAAVMRRPLALDGWETRAACRWIVTGPDTDVFYSPDGERNPKTAERERKAKQVCARCKVREPCLLRALKTREPYGVWGGLTPDERRDLLAARGIQLPKHQPRSAVGGGW